MGCLRKSKTDRIYDLVVPLASVVPRDWDLLTTSLQLDYSLLLVLPVLLERNRSKIGNE